ncbi:DUF4241 domain-containing protein [Mucilaginibacter sp.]|uniref:DUF4241 domain-containing protein n=1 Tax=Mucilaginibacter sp. TaxID=1882438 RepID=UPI0025E9DD78|nr:DUF4241 domain-containing protein [Mucilaginibacter sp.]
MSEPIFKKPNITPYHTLLTILFFAGLILLVAQIKIYHNTFINYVIPTAVWLVTGLVATPLLANTLTLHYNTRSPVLQLVYNLCTWGSIAVYAFMASNFYFGKGSVVTFKTTITKTGELAKGAFGCGEPYVNVVYDGVEKEVIFGCGIPVANYKDLELSVKKGLWGFNVIKTGSLLNEKKGSEVGLHPANYNVYFDSTSYQGTPLKLRQLGELNIPTGKIIVGDPLVTIYNSDPLKKEIKPGKYPVIVCIAKTGKSGDRYAVVKLEVSKNKAVKWELALTAKQHLEDLKGDQIFGFAVDAGLGCFVDVQTRDFFNQYNDSFTKKDKTWNVYDEVLAAEFKKNALDPKDPNDAGDWVNFYLPTKPALNIIMFQSGFGDGFTPRFGVLMTKARYAVW